jgi:hypothetical protein
MFITSLTPGIASASAASMQSLTSASRVEH